MILGFVVVEFNQASRQPSTISDIFAPHEREDAQDAADQAHTETVRGGRKETFAVATLDIDEEARP